MPVTERTMEIFALFQKAVKSNDYSEVSTLSYEEINQADIDMGARDLNSPARMAMKQRMEEIEKKERELMSAAKHREKKIMWAIGILAALIITWIFQISIIAMC